MGLRAHKNAKVRKTLRPPNVMTLSLSLPDRPEVQFTINKRLENNASKNWLKRVFKRFERYEDLIVGALRKAGLPEELALLPAVESAFWEGAVSPKGAGGLWQIMPDTARDLGLKVNEEAVERYKRGEITLKELKRLDERFDVEKSTRAAVRYLKWLYKKFDGDLDMVLAAYNAGPGRVESKVKDFWEDKKKLPKETQNYVPSFYAVVSIYANREQYGLLDEKSRKTQVAQVNQKQSEQFFELTPAV